MTESRRPLTFLKELIGFIGVVGGLIFVGRRSARTPWRLVWQSADELLGQLEPLVVTPTMGITPTQSVPMPQKGGRHCACSR